MKSVAYQGEPGAFSEIAAEQHFGKAKLIPCRDFEGTAAVLLSGVADFAVMPIENSIVGPVPGSRQFLEHPDLQITGELWLPIEHCLLAVPDVTLRALRSVLSHPMAIAQCKVFLASHTDLVPVDWYDTAGAAKHVARRKDITQAAIASRAAADRYGLAIVIENIQDSADNRTRFAILARK